ncbi:MAG: fluoride efflux transporter CrcB [Phycisphaerales bacterium]|nr:fluoride efflux transporter CrcB [Phycisphaerales bacterium]
MGKFLLIFVGSGIGGVLRYALSGWTQKLSYENFPLGTMVVNVSGCLFIGFLSAAFAGRWLVREEYRLALFIGLLGGYTTFSTFGLETFALLNERQIASAAINVLLSVGLGLAAVWCGYRLAETWLGA